MIARLCVVCFTIFFIACSHEMGAQSSLRFSNVDVTAGLSQNTVNAIAEDRYGLLWFGTQDGLNRFDGKNYEAIRSDIEGNTLTDQFVTSIAVASNGDLWVGCRDGFNRILYAGEKIIPFHLESTAESNYQTTKQIVIHENEVALHIGSRLLFMPLNATDTAKAVDADIDNVSAICKSEHGVIIASEHGLYRRNAGNNEVLRSSLPIEGLRGMRVQSDTLLWSDHEVLVLAGNTLRLPVEAKIRDVIRHKEVLWIGTDDGLYLYHDNKVIAAKAFSETSERLVDANVHGFLIDSEDALWLGTNRYGAFRWAPMSASILHLPASLFIDPVIWSAARTDTLLFVGSTRGLNIYQIPVNWPKNRIAPERSLRRTNFIRDLHVSSLLVDQQRLLVGTRKNGVLLVDLSEPELTLSPILPAEDEHICYHIDRITDDLYVVAMNKYIGLLSPDGLLKKAYPSELFSSVQTDYVHHVRYSDGLIYATGTQGVFILDEQLQPIEHISHQADSPSLTFDITGVTADASDDSWWVTYLGGGASKVIGRGESDFTHLGIEDGLRNDVVYSLIDRGDAGTWMATNDGLSVWDGSSVLNFTREDGLPFSEHSQNASGSFNDWLWFGGIDGLYLFRPEEIRMSTAKRLPVVTSLQINYTKMLRASSSVITGDALQPERITLGPNDRSMTLSLSVPGFVQHNNLELCYRFSGIADAWVRLGQTEGRLDFTSLPIGEHQLDIGVAEKNTVPEQFMSVAVQVIPPYYKTTWFRLLMIVLVLLLIGLIVRSIVRRKLREEILKREAIERVQEERQRISMELHDNIGAQITHVITSLDNLSFKVHRGGVKTPEVELDNLSDFARGTMQQLRDTIWTLSREAVDVSSFAERVNDYLGRVLADRERPVFLLNNEVTESIFLDPSTTIHLFRVIQEASNNTLKHANAGRIELTIRHDDNRLLFIFRDDGVGMDTMHANGEHYGLKNMRARMEEIGGRLTISSEKNNGVTIVAELDLS